MAENQVSVDGQRRPLGQLFFVVATQNPIEFRGTYPLPEAQMDRFAMQFDLGYIGPSDEVAVLTAQNDGHPVEKLAPCASLEDIIRLRREGALAALARYFVSDSSLVFASAGSLATNMSSLLSNSPCL